MKYIYNITPKDIVAVEGKPFCVQEKVEMPHVWIRVKDGKAVMLRDKKPITDIDFILDDTYRMIKEDFLDIFMDDKTIEKIIKLCGPCDLKIFYLLDEKPLHIEYKYLYNNAVNYLLSDIWLLDSKADKLKKFEYIDEIVNIVDWGSLISLNMKTGIWTDRVTEIVREYLAYSKSGNDMMFKLTDGAGTISHKGYNSTYGFVLKTGENKWQDANWEYIRESHDEKHSEYRKKVLSDFIDKVLSDKDYMATLPLFIDGRKEKHYSNEQIYLDTIQRVFVQYINNTDLFVNTDMKYTDLMPQHIGKVGSLDMSMLTNDNARVICQYKKLMQEVLRLLIHTFYRINSYTFYNFDEFETKKISDFVLLFS